MKKSKRMSEEEMVELLKTNRTVELVCDDGYYCNNMQNIEVKDIHNGKMAYINKRNDLYTDPTYELNHYPTQKQPNIVELKRGCNGSYLTLDFKRVLIIEGVLADVFFTIESFPIHSKIEYFDLDTKEFVEGEE